MNKSYFDCFEQEFGLQLTDYSYIQYNTVHSHTEYTYRIYYGYFLDIDYAKGFNDLLWLSNLQYYEVNMTYFRAEQPCIIKKYYKNNEMYEFVIN